jgi:hypothetical protein
MCDILKFGAIHKKTGNFVLVQNAINTEGYNCSGCGNDVILRQGDIRVHHFSHLVDSDSCESDIHKSAKTLLKYILDNKIELFIKLNSKQCRCNLKFEYDEQCISKIEHRFCYKNGEYNNIKNGIADLAYIDENNEVKFIFEIYHTHKTKNENRIISKWFEIDASEN